MSIIVQKFGGTLVASEKHRREVINRIIEKVNNKHKLVVVVSAMGRSGDPYSTDSLINLIDKKYCKKRELDLLMSCGEIVSATIISSLLSEYGYNNIVMTGAQAGIITDNNFGNADVIKIMPQKLLSIIENNIVIVAGFQGVTEDGEITTLGRGGSDTSALILGEAIGCEYVEIYTDVEGIMTADPKIVPNAQLIDKICYSEVYQLADEGAKIIHPKAIEIAKRSNIKVIIKNTSNSCKGTTISFYKNDNSVNSIQKKLVTAITYKKNRVQVSVNEYINEENFLNLLNEIAYNKISIDLISILPDRKVFTIDETHLFTMENIFNKGKYKYNIINNCSKISIIGHNINGFPGVMARIINALLKVNVTILQSSDSNTTIWCLVKEEDVEKSIYALHNEFY